MRQRFVFVFVGVFDRAPRWRESWSVSSSSRRHSNTAPSLETVNAASPASPANATCTSGSLCPTSVGGAYPSTWLALNTRAVRSFEPTTTQRLSALQPTHVAASYMPPYWRSSRNGANSLSIVGVAQICRVLPTHTANERPHGENSHAETAPLKFMWCNTTRFLSRRRRERDKRAGWSARRASTEVARCVFSIAREDGSAFEPKRARREWRDEPKNVRGSRRRYSAPQNRVLRTDYGSLRDSVLNNE